MGSTPADIDLINGCIHNDRKAQERLYKQFYVAMMSLCMRYTHNENDAIEVLHNGFLKVYKNIHRFDPFKAGLYTWIRSIMIHSAIDFIRQNVKHSRQVEIDQATEPYVDSEAVNKLNAHEVLHLVRKLPPATQTVFNLYIIEGFTHKEIGIMMGISEGTSKWHLSEARRLMRKLLKTLDAVY
ncbi:MAG TPA: RNA polymerase sigma factor [Agriterribacter sp.]|nr:RNA polymerase sigma factor [Agriterribacter sp.]HRQ49473.1 RNA polymerase sigma factor [Agriterribacter sp.]